MCGRASLTVDPSELQDAFGLSRDWTEFLSALIARRVRFVLVGGHAVAGHGEPLRTELEPLDLLTPAPLQ